ncbi:hypothetical protein RR46_09804 [Papilio xuthus]|uniref:Uncharacterized protein n=1 Tax=Papilio xuthus TaxID=66420 RepID=A0A194QGM9_PAPXU|nr:hypothetical protein RR46_09804 [Papilio xuthus]
MDKSLATTIEEIKLQEQNAEIKLKENRDLESTIASLNKNIREIVIQIEKSEKEQRELTKRINKLRSQQELDKIRRDALLAQIEASRKELEELRRKSDEGITTVWNIRSSLCNAVQMASDNYDVMALLMKPKSVVTLPKAKILPVKEESEFDRKLKEVTQRKQNAVKDRDRLLNEPETGHEFVRSCFRRHNARTFSSRNVEVNENEPIKFSTSGAAAKKTIRPIKNIKIDMPWYQPYCVIGSVTIFLLYFCILREENDVDLEFNKSLYERIQGLEKTQLLLSYKHNKEHGKSVLEIERRLKEIEEEEKMKEANTVE